MKNVRAPVPKSVPKKYDQNPRNGLTVRQLLKTNEEVDLANRQTVRVLSAKSGSVKLNGMLRPGTMFKVREVGRKEPKPKTRDCVIIVRDTATGDPKVKNTNVVVSCDCLTGDTKVLTSDGWKQMQEIAEPVQPDNFPITYMINGKPYPGTAPFHKGKAEVYELRLASGKSIKATADHRFLVRGERKYVGQARTPVQSKNRWVRLKNLTIGSKLIANDFVFEPIKHNREFYEAYFIGALMGDGTLFSIGTPDMKIYSEDKRTILSSAFKKAHVLDSVKAHRIIFNRRAYELMVRYEYKNKQSVKLTNLTQVLGYLSGLFATDGTCNGATPSISGGAYLFDLQDQLSRYGYRTHIILSRKAGTKTNVSKATKNMYMLCILAATAQKLQTQIALEGSKKAGWDTFVAKKTHDRLPWVKVTGVTYKGKQHVYDITVPGKHCFVAEGVIVHNCEFYMYYCEYALTHYKAGFIKHSNGAAPNTTNPRLIPFTCKHLDAALRHVLTM